MVGLALTCGLILLGGSAPARGAAPPSVKASHAKQTSSVELGLQGTAVGSGGSLQTTFLGAVITLQGAQYWPVSAMFQFGVGAGLDEDPQDPDSSRATDQFWMALGARLRPLAFGGRRGLVDFYVGPLVGVLASHEIVALTVGAEVGVALRFGRARRFRLSLTGHGGWASILHQELLDRLDANWHAGGQLSFGFGF